MKNPQLLLILYIILAVIEIIADITEIRPIIYVTKPLLMPILMLWFFALTPNKSSKFKKIIAVSIVCSFFGDTFLLFVEQNEIFFLLGLGSFLIGQLLYGWAFILNIKASNNKGDLRLNILFAILFGAFYFLLMNLLFPKLGEFLVPVIIYGLAICFMGLTAAYRYYKVSMSSFYLVLAGALTFVVSDTCIALDKFYFPSGFPYAQALIMFTYCTAQYLIVKGCVQNINASN
jgi:uncharacterized membrane protein YhhN